MIPSQRFETFTKNQNLGLASVSELKSSEIYNTVTNKLTTITDDLKSIANSVKQSLTPIAAAIKSIDNMVDSALRTVKDVFTSIKDMTSMSISEVEGMIADLLPDNPTLQNAFRTLTRQCRDNAMSKRSGFKPFNDKAKCGSGNGKCSTGEVSNLLNKITDGAIGVAARAIQSLLDTLIMLGNLGYSAGLCKIFATLINGMPKGVVQRGASVLLATLGGSGNTTAVMDITANMGNVNPSAEIPGLVTRVAENFDIPDNYSPGDYPNLYEAYQGSLVSIQPGFDKSEDGVTDSVANLGQPNAKLQATATSFLRTSVFTDPTEPSAYDGMLTAAAYTSGATSSFTRSNFFG